MVDFRMTMGLGMQKEGEWGLPSAQALETA